MRPPLNTERLSAVLPWLAQKQKAYEQPDGRSVKPRKWHVSKHSGPVVLFAETVQKILIQHGWAVSIRRVHPRPGKGRDGKSRLVVQPEGWAAVQFYLDHGRHTPEFTNALKVALAIVGKRYNVKYDRLRRVVWLSVPYDLELTRYRGAVRRVLFVERTSKAVSQDVPSEPPWPEF